MFEIKEDIDRTTKAPIVIGIVLLWRDEGGVRLGRDNAGSG